MPLRELGTRETMRATLDLLAGAARSVLKMDRPGRQSRLCFGMVALALCLAARAADPGNTLSSLGQVRSLSLEDGAKAIPVKTRAVVTFCDPERRLLFLQDSSGAVSVQAAPDRGLQPGNLVELEAVTTRGRAHCNVRFQAIRAEGEAPMPVPREPRPDELLSNANDCRWVKVQGYLPNLVRYGARLNLQMVLRPGLTLELIVMEGDSPEARELAGAMVEACGVLTVRYDSAGKMIGGRLYASNPAAVRRLKPLPVVTLAELITPAASPPPDEPVQVRATVLNHNLGEFLMLRDASGTLRLPFKDLNYFDSGRLVQVFCWPLQRKPDLVLTNVAVKPWIADSQMAESAVEILTPAAANTNLPGLTQIAQVRRLSPQDASRGYPVHLTAVMTYSDLTRYMHFLQDDSAGIYMDLSKVEPKPQLFSGCKVELQGFSAPGDYAPIVIAQQIRTMGKAPLPPPQSVSFQKMMTGSYDSQWVQLKGVVRNQWWSTNLTTLGLYTGDGVVKILVPEQQNAPPPRNYIDAAVELSGVCTTQFDERRRLQGVEVQVPDWSQVRVTEATVEDPFTLPVKPIAGLLQFAPGSGDLHRTRVMGVVLLKLRDGTFYLQDASGGIQIQPQSQVPVRVGSAADVVGFPVLVDRQPVLQNALFKPVPSTTPLDPADLKPESLLEENLQGTLVRFDGQVLGHFSRASEELLTVQLGSSIIEVRLEKGQSEDQLADIRPGSTVRLTGVWLASADENGASQQITLLLRSASDVRVLATPSWWTPHHTTRVLSGLVALLVLGLGWLRALQRQVKQRTLELNHEIEHHKRTEAQLEAEIAERLAMEAEVEKTHQDLLAASREAGMAEVATSVLHNVGNVLNSVNVSAHVLDEKIKASKTSSLAKAAGLLREHALDLPEFLTLDPKGRQLPQFLTQLSDHLSAEQKHLLKEVDLLGKNLDHIKQIIATQQHYARVMGVTESLHPAELVEDALRINEESLSRRGIQICRQYAAPLPKLTVDKHKALQVLINLIRNAGSACEESSQAEKRMTLHLANGDGRLKISVSDNGIGIAPENLTRIFNHGFTTRRDGHGFGLHSGALAAKEMGGTLHAHSTGPGQGATFTLELPVQ
jgi:signal transduction histidine kinase